MKRALPHRWAMALGSAALVAGCGFQPVYMPTASGKPGPAERNLAAIHVNLIPDRPGQELRQDLQERFGSDSGGSSRYNLAVSFSVSGEGIGILPDTIATRIRLIANATWTLTTPDGAHITNGAARALDAFNVLDQQYFAADMDNDALQQRLASVIADQITMQLAAYFRRQDAVALR
ncbi:MAG TPA: LPS assembly lipoprotein LptE [Acetobacteraceae bacterium]|jgi:LPS-assembly lipoprotein|nr:LPS assembly lipoprotein LptE [Acetobacteraceae bacterium]